MIEQKQLLDQLPKEIKPAFQELKVLKHLNAAVSKRSLALPVRICFASFSFCCFARRTSFESFKGETFPGKDTVYRFLNHSGYAWRRFLLSLSSETVRRVRKLTSAHRETVFIFDDSMFERNRSKAVEMLARFKDHATGAYYKGFRMLTMGWSDGHSFIPMDFALLSSTKSGITGMMEGIDKRSAGYKRRLEAFFSAPQVIAAMLDRAIQSGVSASFVLMDSWFTHAPLIQEVMRRGLYVIGMVKNDNKRYIVGGQRICLKALYAVAPRVEGKNRNILRLIRTDQAPGIPVTVVFVRHRSMKNEWLAILSTDLTLSAQEIIRIYRIRWEIEVFFKCAKSLLRLQKEFQGRSYDLLVSHTTIVFSRYILLAWQHRQSTNQRFFGGLFYLLCDEVDTLDWAVALQQLVEVMNEIVTQVGKKLSAMIKSQLQHWISALPSYIKDYLPISCWSSRREPRSSRPSQIRTSDCLTIMKIDDLCRNSTSKEMSVYALYRR
ncbi:Transposase DDE domain-containing protein [Paenibacillus sophorae]|uniref:Transposase DDE domain-containing protein n=1 Tax=Paenibacillus sophorae TaxID=1333845 RepID=A0A1H8PZ32_9BACL|nr:Transposase DDE domain-containing protein [Paenibacillus sophorae]